VRIAHPRVKGVIMNGAYTTAVAAASRGVGLMGLVCGAAAASLVALAAAVEPVHSAHPTTVSAVALANRHAAMYGDPAAAAPFWGRQHGGDCGEMAVADVVGQVTGHEPAEPQIISVAESTPSTTGHGVIYSPNQGTDLRDLPTLLAHYGVRSVLGPSSIGALEEALAQRHPVIAAVNAATLWNSRGNRRDDDHVVVVTGIDTAAGVVHLNDSGIDTGRDEQVSLSTFEKAWAASGNLAVVAT
jgi:hypothetical protein